MKIDHIKKHAFAMPLTSPSALSIEYKFKNREYLIIEYESDSDALNKIVPEPLKVMRPIVKFEFIKMPDAHGFGSFVEAGQIIEVAFDNKKGTYAHIMYLNDLAPIAAGREIWGFPKKYGNPNLTIDVDTVLGTLKYNSVDIAIGTMGYKYHELDTKKICQQLIDTPNYLLKIIPHVDGKTVSLCQLIRYYLKDVTVHGAWSGPAALQLFEHALAPVSQLPIRKIISGTHLIVDFTLGFGEVVYDYLEGK